jgi:1,4-alpha-glucan branching enzyme
MLRKFGKKEKKRWTPGLLRGYWFRVWSPNPKTVFLHLQQVYIALEKSLHRQTDGQREAFVENLVC